MELEESEGTSVAVAVEVLVLVFAEGGSKRFTARLDTK